MYTIDPAPGAISEAVKAIPKGQPVVMLNLLSFRETATYENGGEVSGREAYATYSRGAIQHVRACGGEVVFMGAARFALVAPPDEEWDEVLLVRYPSIEAFVAMVMNPEYQALSTHRTAALRNARLIATLEHVNT